MSEQTFNGPITLAFSGASGAPYGLRLLEVLVSLNYQVYVLISSAARVVLDTESNLKLSGNEQKATEQLQTLFCAKDKQIQVFGKDNWFSLWHLARPHQSRWWCVRVAQEACQPLHLGHLTICLSAQQMW